MRPARLLDSIHGSCCKASRAPPTTDAASRRAPTQHRHHECAGARPRLPRARTRQLAQHDGAAVELPRAGFKSCAQLRQGCGKARIAAATRLRTGGSCGNWRSQRTAAGALAAAAAAGVAAVAAAASAAAGPAAATVVAAAAAAAALQLMQLLQMQRRVQQLHQPQQSDSIFTAAAQQVHISSTAGLQQDSRSFATDPSQLCRSSTAALPQL